MFISMMMAVTDLRAGRVFGFNSEPYQVVEYKHTKLGRGTANIKVKARNLRTGKIMEKTFISGAKVESLETESRELQYLYQDSEGIHLMNPVTFEQFLLPVSVLGERASFLKEGQKVKVLFAEEKPLSVELPTSLVFRVTESPPGVKGDSATASFKQVTLDNNLVVKVPLFIKKGNSIKIDTKTGSYVERVK